MRLSSEWKRGRLEQLSKEKNERLRRGFDRLLAIPGLWLDGMRASMLHRVIAVTAVEVSFFFFFFLKKKKISNLRLNSLTCLNFV